MKSKEDIALYQKAYREKNKGKRRMYMKEYSTKYYLSNKERLKPIRDGWESKNKDKRSIIAKRYYLKNVEKIKEISIKNKRRRIDAVIRFNQTEKGIYNRYKLSAKKRNLEFSLTSEEFKEILNKNCRYCGDSKSRGIDRVDNRIGYTTSNSVPCCYMCNRMKWVWTEEQFKGRIKQIYKNLYL
jgi:hypothetical protein